MISQEGRWLRIIVCLTTNYILTPNTHAHGNMVKPALKGTSIQILITVYKLIKDSPIFLINKCTQAKLKNKTYFYLMLSYLILSHKLIVRIWLSDSFSHHVLYQPVVMIWIMGWYIYIACDTNKMSCYNVFIIYFTLEIYSDYI
jgi:hypothetical protein